MTSSSGEKGRAAGRGKDSEGCREGAFGRETPAGRGAPEMGSRAGRGPAPEGELPGDEEIQTGYGKI